MGGCQPPTDDPSMVKLGGRFLLYDEKFIMGNSLRYSKAAAQAWMQKVKDYVAGRHSDMDAIFAWIESQSEAIDPGGLQPMQDLVTCASLSEIWRQLWAMVGALIAEDVGASSIFANVPRHNGLEAWRRITEPINEDKLLIVKQLLPKITNPRPAKDIDDVQAAMIDWET